VDSEKKYERREKKKEKKEQKVEQGSGKERDAPA
jgi:hypothetical protein